jgi:hypothetical protein
MDGGVEDEGLDFLVALQPQGLQRIQDKLSNAA